MADAFAVERSIDEAERLFVSAGQAKVEPQIAAMEADLQAAISASASGDVIAMLRSYEALKGWTA